MTVNNRLNWGMALILVYPVVFLVVIVFHSVYLIDFSPAWLMLEKAISPLSCLASVVGAILVMLPYLDASKDLETAYRRVDKGIAAGIGLYWFHGLIPLLFFGNFGQGAFTGFALNHLLAIIIAGICLLLMWMYGLWCFRPKAVLIGILGLVTLMALPNPKPDDVDFTAAQWEQGVSNEGLNEETGTEPLESGEDAILDMGEDHPLPSGSPGQIVHTTANTRVVTAFRGYFILMVAYSFMRLGGQRWKQAEIQE